MPSIALFAHAIPVPKWAIQSKLDDAGFAGQMVCVHELCTAVLTVYRGGAIDSMLRNRPDELLADLSRVVAFLLRRCEWVLVSTLTDGQNPTMDWSLQLNATELNTVHSTGTGRLAAEVHHLLVENQLFSAFSPSD